MSRSATERGTCLVHFSPGSIGIDNSSEAVTFTRALGLEARLLDVDDETLTDIPDAAFDYVWVSDILEHLEAPRLLLRNLRPKLKPGGSLIVHTSVLPGTRLVRHALRRLHRAPFDARAHYHQFTIETIKHLIERAGYRTVATEVPIPPRDARLGAVIPQRAVPRVMLEGRRDPEFEEIADRFERKNKHVQ